MMRPLDDHTMRFHIWAAASVVAVAVMLFLIFLFAVPFLAVKP